mmetsp:Transcript_66938/g.173526  ORF Transcript_66938/g.173526 Transcript_66938/m.173526 type:complete len:220 (+) Transcript_66938:757-1416(+)
MKLSSTIIKGAPARIPQRAIATKFGAPFFLSVLRARVAERVRPARRRVHTLGRTPITPALSNHTMPATSAHEDDTLAAMRVQSVWLQALARDVPKVRREQPAEGPQSALPIMELEDHTWILPLSTVDAQRCTILDASYQNCSIAPCAVAPHTGLSEDAPQIAAARALAKVDLDPRRCSRGRGGGRMRGGDGLPRHCATTGLCVDAHANSCAEGRAPVPL